MASIERMNIECTVVIISKFVAQITISCLFNAEFVTKCVCVCVCALQFANATVWNEWRFYCWERLANTEYPVVCFCVENLRQSVNWIDVHWLKSDHIVHFFHIFHYGICIRSSHSVQSYYYFKRNVNLHVSFITTINVFILVLVSWC